MVQDHAIAKPVVLRAEDFEPLVGRLARFGETGFALTLDEVERKRGPCPAGLPRAPFSLVFSGPKGSAHLADGIHRCDFGDGMVFDIHVAPIATFAADRQDYEAVFS